MLNQQPMGCGAQLTGQLYKQDDYKASKLSLTNVTFILLLLLLPMLPLVLQLLSTKTL